MIRHGQASFGSENYDRLSQKGRIQARVVAEYLEAAGISADLIYSGEMKRQTGTAAARVFARHRKTGQATAGYWPLNGRRKRWISQWRKRCRQ
jgi:broad specificity phosphatase PhoE